jgi:ATP-dependent Clp protease ATP-binding subunit ClpA
LVKKELFSYLFERGIFRPEFVNRFDAVVVFTPLSKNNLLDISQLILGKLKKDLLGKDIDFEISQDLKEKIVELSYSPEFGAREMKRVVQDKIENSLARAVLGGEVKRGDRIKIDPLTFKVVKY